MLVPDRERNQRELEEFDRRVEALAEARRGGRADLAATLDAALLELDLARKMLRAEVADDAVPTPDSGGQAAAHERRLLREMFLAVPAPMLLLEPDGTTRRGNRAAARLLDVPLGYLTGKPFTAFVDTASRGAFRSHLAATVRRSPTPPLMCRLAAGRRQIQARLTLTALDLAEDTTDSVLVLAWPMGTDTEVAAEIAGPPAADLTGLEEQARRLELLSAMGRLLLGETAVTEQVVLLRAARLLASLLADWALIDIDHDGRLERAIVAGDGDELGDLQLVPPTRTIRDVFDSGQPLLDGHVEDAGQLGTLPDGRSVLLATDTASLLATPIGTDGGPLGVLTLLRSRQREPFGLPDLAVAEEIGVHLGLSLRVERRLHQREEIVEVLAASLRPRSLLLVPGVEAAALYHTAAEEVRVGGDFYDVFGSPGGWGFALGDVCGKGEAAATVTAMVRHAIRLLSLTESDPAVVLSRVNDALLAQHERYVTCVAGHLTWQADGLHVTLVTAGHVPPYLLEAPGRLRPVGGGGRPLGLFEDVSLATTQMVLRPGDTLLLYSDGLTDARDAAGQVFGEERLTEVLIRGHGVGAAALLDRLERRVLEHCDGRYRDDIAVLALQVVSR